MSISSSNIILRGFNFAARSIKRITRGNLTDQSFSNFAEQSVINSYLQELNIDNGYCVDIAASDGITMSNTYALYEKGWNGLAVEFDARKFSKLEKPGQIYFFLLGVVKSIWTQTKPDEENR